MSTAGWIATNNLTLAAVAATPTVNGVTTAMSMTSVAGGLMSSTLATSHRVAATPGQTYTLMASYQAAAIPQQCRVIGQFYTAGGATIGAQVLSPLVTDAVGTWTLVSFSTVAPATAATLGLILQVQTTAGAAEVHYVACVGAFAGLASFWSNSYVLQGSALQIASNLSDVADIGTARGNLRVPVLTLADCAATANVAALSGLGTYDGYTLLAGDTIMLPFQSTSSQGGPWIAAAGAWTRPSEFATGQTVRGRTITVKNGTLYTGSTWILNAPSAGIVVDTNNQTWTAAPGSVGSYQAQTEIVTATGAHNAPAWATRLHLRMVATGGDGSGGASMSGAVVSTTLTNGSPSGTTLNFSTNIPQAIASGATITVKDGVGATQAFTLTSGAAANAASVAITSVTVTLATGSGYTAWGTTWTVAGGSGGGAGQEVRYDIAVTGAAAGTATIGTVGAGGTGATAGGNPGLAGSNGTDVSFAIGGVTYKAAGGKAALGPAANSPTYASSGLYGADGASSSSVSNPGYPGQGGAPAQPVPLGSVWGGPHGAAATPLLGGTGGTGYQLGANNANNATGQTGTTAGGAGVASNAVGCGGAGGGGAGIGGAGGNGSPGTAGAIYLAWSSA